MPATKPRRRKTYPVRELLERLEEVHGKPRMIARFDPLEELVSCIMSQHTTDASSFPAFTKLRETYPDWQDVADEEPEKIAKVIWKAGLANQKSKSIINCLKQIKERTGEYSLESLRDMPMLEARKWLMSLPGVGPKTASIVLCFSFGMGAIPVDTHVYRVSWRLGLIDEGVGENKAHDLLLEIVPEDLAYRYHTTIIQHGRKTCKAPLPICEECVVADLCQWFKKGGPEKRRKELKAKGKTKTKAK